MINRKKQRIKSLCDNKIDVHEGTQKMAPNRFLKNAIEANKEQIKQKAIQALRNI